MSLKKMIQQKIQAFLEVKQIKGGGGGGGRRRGVGKTSFILPQLNISDFFLIN